MKLSSLFASACVLAALSSVATATETQNTDLRVLPAPAGGVTIDGDISEWNLAAGVFACGELEHLRDQYAVWMHAMYDADNVYLLARWRDPTPLNNTETFGGHGFNGDCLQVRFILFPDTPDATATWWSFWRDALGTPVAEVSSPGERNGWRQRNLPALARAEEQGAKQAFRVDDDGTGYLQEIAIPWKLLGASGAAPEAGSMFRFTVEPNFTAGSFGRITIKDIFDDRTATPDRIFTFRAFKHWGRATLVAPGAEVATQPVKTADGRAFAVSMVDGKPVVDWTGLIRRFEWPGFKDISFDMPFDGYVSLMLVDSEGRVARHLLNWDLREKGPQTVKWDGLSDATYRTPGTPVPAGSYTWKAIAHPGAKITFRGYASYGGAAPWQGQPNDTWLGDHGVPSDAAVDADRVYLACNGAEGGRHLLATDFDGNVVWSLQNTTGMGDPEHIAVADGSVYILLPTYKAGESDAIAKADATTGAYTTWKSRKSHVLTVKEIAPNTTQAAPIRLRAIAAGGGSLFVAFRMENIDAIAMLDADTGSFVKAWPANNVTGLHYVNAHRVLVANADGISELDPAFPGFENGAFPDLAATVLSPIVQGVANVNRVTASPDGKTIYASLRAPDMQVVAYDAASGRELRRYGIPGGHPRVGKWNQDGMIDPAGVAVDKLGQLWVMERYAHPKRVSVWNTESGAFVRDFFGPTHYGASGAAINPRDPNLMVGEGCEWRMDPATGKSECLGAFDTDYHSFATYREGANGRLYLVVNKMRYGDGIVKILERRGDADFRLVAEIRNDREADDGGKRVRFTDLWVDLNGDGERQPDETQTRAGALFFAGSNSWSLNLGPDLAFYAFDRNSGLLCVMAPDGFAESGAPRYSLATLRELPAAMSAGYQPNYSCAIPDRDNKVLLANLKVPDHPAGFLWHGFDLATGDLLWTYPNPFFQVHGSHNAPAPDPGLFRGAYGPIGNLATGATGPFWVINGNLGEWYTLTSDGFFLTQLFNGNVFDWVWPEKPVPGVDMSNLPCGCGGEDFGGSVTQGDDGRLYLQSGKNAVWNLELENIEKAVRFAGAEPVVLTEEDIARAATLREEALQASAGVKKMTVKSGAPSFSGNFGADFRNYDIVEFQKTRDSRVRASAAFDDANLYLGWEVYDATPWANGAVDFAQMYAFGDTVDFQLGTDPDAKRDRGAAAKGDLRLSIGNLQGSDTAVLYKFVSDEKNERTFTSGVVKGYVVDFVDIVRDAAIKTQVYGDRYVVEAAIPLAALGVHPQPDMVLRGDFGATHGTPSGDDTRLRTYWSNQQTGLADDVVFELQVTPKNWGELSFE